MKKTIILVLVVILLLIATSTVLAGAKNALFFEWLWPGTTYKSAFFQKTGSGIYHFWSYDRPGEPDIHFIAKPLDKFSDASCDEGAIKDNSSWTPQGIYNRLIGEKPEYMSFWGGELGKPYYLCGYPIE